jgi:hypothetical protein
MKLREAITKAANEAETQPSFIGQAWAELFVGSLEAKGFAIVPKEATREIEDAHFACHAKAQTVFAEFPDLWRAMLAARPTIED